MKKYDKIIIGAGIYGLYSAIKCGQSGQTVLVLEYDDAPFRRASYVNQARVHNGYHYPRSLSTAKKSANYYHRFHEDFGFAIHNQFDQVYATSEQFSWTNAEAFVRFCTAAGIRCKRISPDLYFRPNMCDGAFLTEEDTYDACIICDYFIDKIDKLKNIEIQYNVRIDKIIQTKDSIQIIFNSNKGKVEVFSPFLLNATYASTNQIINLIENEEGKKINYEKFKIKYELCEIVLCSVSDNLKGVGLTMMDGPFFSIMPFGKTKYHSLTSVTFTPHITSYEDFPVFACQNGINCSPEQLNNCNECEHKPASAWDYMSHLAKKYMNPELLFSYEKSLFSMKPILKLSEIDDSRPTAIMVNSETPKIVSVLSGKINTIYDLDEYLEV